MLLEIGRFRTNSTSIITSAELLNTHADNRYGIWHNEKASKNFYVQINGNKVLQNTLELVAYKCPKASSPCVDLGGAVNPSIQKVWGQNSHWTSGAKPVDGEDVTIEADWLMKLNQKTAKLRNLFVYGVLEFDNTVDNLELIASNIIIFGEIRIGTPSFAFSNNAKIILHGSASSVTSITVDNNLKTTRKSLMNFRLLNIYGKDKAPYKAKLLAAVIKGATSINIDKDLKWEVGDEILISTTNQFSEQTEKRVILTYEKTTGVLTFATGLLHKHYGATTVPEHLKNPTAGAMKLDQRSDIFMISRNIKIMGDNANKTFGCNIMTSSVVNNSVDRIGVSNIYNVEIQNCGQKETEFSALQFKKHGTKNGVEVAGIVSTVQGVSFTDNNYYGIKLDDISMNVRFKEIIVYKTYKIRFVYRRF